MAFDLTVRESYANALLSVASGSDRLEQVCASARELADYFGSLTDRRLRTFVESPQIPNAEKHGLIRAMFAGRVDPLLVDLVCLMIGKRRPLYVAPVLRRFCELVDARRGLFPGVVSTAKALSDEDKSRLQSRLEAFTGDRLWLRYRVDEDLIGGVMFKYRDLLIDDTLRDGLNQMAASLEAVRLRLAPPEVSETA
jgi:F-type H+-transporting ATPase subunit delta